MVASDKGDNVPPDTTSPIPAATARHHYLSEGYDIKDLCKSCGMLTHEDFCVNSKCEDFSHQASEEERSWIDGCKVQGATVTHNK